MDINEFFQKHNKVALAFSGGVDSSYLLLAGIACYADIKPYYVKSQFQPEFEMKDALHLAGILGVEPEIIKLDVLGCDMITSNPSDRCYHCKSHIMSEIKKHAAIDGYDVIIDGTNASDKTDDRPGMKALQELGILSPLRECGLTKQEIRHRSKNACLFTWNKPAYACLATRVTAGEKITSDKLQKIEKSEEYLFSLGFSDFRVRVTQNVAALQFTSDQIVRARKCFDEISTKLSEYFPVIQIDPAGRGETI